MLEVINGSGELMKELDRRLKVLDQVIRHLVVRVGRREAGRRPDAHETPDQLGAPAREARAAADAPAGRGTLAGHRRHG